MAFLCIKVVAPSLSKVGTSWKARTCCAPRIKKKHGRQLYKILLSVFTQQWFYINRVAHQPTGIVHWFSRNRHRKLDAYDDDGYDDDGDIDAPTMIYVSERWRFRLLAILKIRCRLVCNDAMTYADIVILVVAIMNDLYPVCTMSVRSAIKNRYTFYDLIRKLQELFLDL